MKNVVFSLSAVAVAAAAWGAVPQPSGVSMSQDASRKVTITYNLANAPAVVTLDIETNVTADAWVSIGGKHVRTVTGDACKIITEPGEHVIYWQPDVDWPEHQVGDGGVRAKVVAWEVDATPECLVVDISDSADKADNRRYYPSLDNLPGGILGNPDYRTNKIVLRKIRAKDFPWTKGSYSEAGRDRDGRESQYAVMLTNDFYMAVFETTQQQYFQVMSAWPNSFFTMERTMRPVERIDYGSLRGASEWPAAPASGSVLDKFRAKTGIDFDLPSEAQWEFACRAGNGEGYWGNGNGISTASTEIDDGLQSRYKYNGGCNAEAQYAPYDASVAPDVGGTAVVGSYLPNNWGLYDMHGNVSEWCLDWWTNDLNTLKNLKGAVNTNKGTMRSLRGGNISAKACACRSAFSNATSPSRTSEGWGFRLACTGGLR